jgi:hypothetical protein
MVVWEIVWLLVREHGGCPEFRRTSVAVPVIIMPLSGPRSGVRH